MTAYIQNKYASAARGQATAVITAEDAAIFSLLTKISRAQAGLYHRDNYVDGACYMAIAGEAAYDEYAKQELAQSHARAVENKDLSDQS